MRIPLRLPRSNRRLLAVRDNRNINNNILFNPKNILHAITTPLQLEYPRLNTIVLGNQQHTIANNNLNHMDNALFPAL